MQTGLTITLIGMTTVFIMLGLMISAVKLLTVIFSRKNSEKLKNKEDKDIAIALAALKSVLG
ncbi:MAG: OadG family protein [Spirochaetia bacterium]|jgi:Na+-transporting methylmalonyl-CoA/oxaloacetate decarboxylase gamma subunit|nr:OadG family protein [Spirochaetia bacterium]